VAIIALLISILLPSLGRAREQAKPVVCASNLRQIGTAMHFYFDEHKNWFPFEKSNNHNYLHGMYYGGHPGRSRWWGYADGRYRDTPNGRPFNRYLYPNLPNYDVRPSDPQFEVVRNLPVYQCPSDRGGFWQTDAGGAPNFPSQYYECGTSYTTNYHFVLSWALGFHNGGRWLQRSNAYLRHQLQRHSSTFVILYEDPFDSALWLGMPRRGWHRMWNRHNLLFLDGHSANTYTDTSTREWHMGTGWKTGSGNSPRDSKAWWMRPTNVDFWLRNIPPLGG